MTEEEEADAARREQYYAILLERKRAYQLAFNSLAGQEVVKDLKAFGCDIVSTMRSDVHETFALEGRRQVLLRIREHLELEVPKLYETYVKRGGDY